MHDNWFDSLCLLRLVLKCLNMKRAILTLESTVIAIGILLLKEVIADEDYMENLLHSARNSLDGVDGSPEFSSSWTAFCTNMT